MEYLAFLKLALEWGLSGLALVVVVAIGLKIIVGVFLPVIKELREIGAASSEQMGRSVSSLQDQLDNVRKELRRLEEENVFLRTQNREMHTSQHKMHLEIISLRQRLEIALQILSRSGEILPPLKDFLTNSVPDIAPLGDFPATSDEDSDSRI